MPTTAAYTAIPHWAALRRRYLALWERRVEDNRIVVHIQNPNPAQPDPAPWMLGASAEKYLDPAKLYDLKEWRRTAWNWHTDLYQYIIPSYGPNVFIDFCGARPVFGANTVWREPVISSLDEAETIHFDEANSNWRQHLETVAYFVERCAGERQLGMTDLGGPTDWVADLMGAENFLIAAWEEPERMRDFVLRLAEECCRAYDLLRPRLTMHNDGLCDWMPNWSDRPMFTTQDDMAINLSPELYREVFLPAQHVLAHHTGRTVLHWHDGCPQHLDTLLAVEGIELVQLGHDPNSPPFRAMLPLMQRIQTAGKCLFISCVEAEDVQFFIEHLDPRGLMMIINTTDDDASRRMEEDVAIWTAARLATMAD
jgi:hypothetical protein